MAMDSRQGTRGTQERFRIEMVLLGKRKKRSWGQQEQKPKIKKERKTRKDGHDKILERTT